MNPYASRDPMQFANRVEAWYGHYIPSLNTRKFGLFAQSSHSLCSLVCGKRVPIQVAKAATASVTLEEPIIITLPEYYFNDEALTKLFPECHTFLPSLSAISLSLINGSIIHESLHIRYTAISIQKLIESIDADLRGTASLIFNVVEDLYIEYHGYKTQYGDWLHMKNAILFTQKMADFSIKAAEQRPYVSEVVNALVCLKNRSIKFETKSDFLNTVKKLVDQVYELNDVQRRFDLAVEIAKLFPATYREHTINSIMTARPTYEEESNTALILPENVKKVISAFVSSKVRNAEKEISEFGHVPSLKEIDVINASQREDTGRVEVDKSKYVAFARLLKQLRVVNRIPGIPHVRGRHIASTRLSRIITDQKIFVINGSQKIQMRVEVIILVDASSSMNAGSSISQSRWVKASGSAQSTYEALKSANIPCSIYCHTSELDHTTPLVIHVASNQMLKTTTSIKSRFARMNRLILTENFDGFAIARMAEKFTKRPAHRLLIVISDGRPAGWGYGGQSASEHTRAAIESLRRIGINVICFSVANDVISSNDRLYGKENNVNCTENLDSEFRRIISKLIKESKNVSDS